MPGLEASAGVGQVKVGHFQRFSHDKVMILKQDGQALKVLSGSANFSICGLYVQSNNVFVIDDPATASLYEQAFEQSWNDAQAFEQAEISKQWFDCGGSNGLPSFSVCFSPHADAGLSLDLVAAAVKNATSSVLFAIMEIGAGGGPLLEQIEALPTRTDLYAFGTTQRLDGDLKVEKTGADATFIPFAYLNKQVPAPFRKEWSGGSGQVIHHKFVVTDFNSTNPTVFAGSSNLAKGGEEANGDNLVCITDRHVATIYAIEAIKLIDHYRFRALMEQATEAAPLELKGRSQNWAADYYDTTNPNNRERTLFIAEPPSTPADVTLG